MAKRSIVFAQPNKVWQSYVLGLPHSTLHLVIFVWDFSKVKNVYIFVRKLLSTIQRNWLGRIGRESCGSSMTTYSVVTSRKVFSNWSSSCFNLSLNFLKSGNPYLSPSSGFCKYSITCLLQEHWLVTSDEVSLSMHKRISITCKDHSMDVLGSSIALLISLVS